MNNISVAVATYNGEKYLAAQLDSILQQTHPAIEIIIVDDCSCDNTWSILQKYAEQYPQIKLHQNEANLGACLSFAKAISLCNGDYIALADQDDVWLPNKLAALLDNIGDSLLIHSDAFIVDENLNILANTFSKGVMNQTNFIDYLFANNVTGCTCMFARDLISKSFSMPDFYMHDHYLAISASYLGTIKYLPQPLIYYRQHTANQIGENKQVNFDKFIRARTVVGSSLKNLAIHPTFTKSSQQINLIADYHLSIAVGKWHSNASVLNLLKLKKGIKYICSFYILIGFGVTRLAKFLYTILKK
jgi:glycosyltransferase involved in cell wall biosynthesis